jgi:hypothetical protein
VTLAAFVRFAETLVACGSILKAYELAEAFNGPPGDTHLAVAGPFRHIPRSSRYEVAAGGDIGAPTLAKLGYPAELLVQDDSNVLVATCSMYTFNVAASAAK